MDAFNPLDVLAAAAEMKQTNLNFDKQTTCNGEETKATKMKSLVTKKDINDLPVNSHNGLKTNVNGSSDVKTSGAITNGESTRKIVSNAFPALKSALNQGMDIESERNIKSLLNSPQTNGKVKVNGVNGHSDVDAEKLKFRNSEKTSSEQKSICPKTTTMVMSIKGGVPSVTVNGKHSSKETSSGSKVITMKTSDINQLKSSTVALVVSTDSSGQKVVKTIPVSQIKTMGTNGQKLATKFVKTPISTATSTTAAKGGQVSLVTSKVVTSPSVVESKTTVAVSLVSSQSSVVTSVAKPVPQIKVSTISNQSVLKPSVEKNETNLTKSDVKLEANRISKDTIVSSSSPVAQTSSKTENTSITTSQSALESQSSPVSTQSVVSSPLTSAVTKPLTVPVSAATVSSDIKDNKIKLTALTTTNAPVLTLGVPTTGQTINSTKSTPTVTVSSSKSAPLVTPLPQTSVIPAQLVQTKLSSGKTVFTIAPTSSPGTVNAPAVTISARPGPNTGKNTATVNVLVKQPPLVPVPTVTLGTTIGVINSMHTKLKKVNSIQDNVDTKTNDSVVPFNLTSVDTSVSETKTIIENEKIEEKINVTASPESIPATKSQKFTLGSVGAISEQLSGVPVSSTLGNNRGLQLNSDLKLTGQNSKDQDETEKRGLKLITTDSAGDLTLNNRIKLIGGTDPADHLKESSSSTELDFKTPTKCTTPIESHSPSPNLHIHSHSSSPLPKELVQDRTTPTKGIVLGGGLGVLSNAKAIGSLQTSFKPIEAHGQRKSARGNGFKMLGQSSVRMQQLSESMGPVFVSTNETPLTTPGVTSPRMMKHASFLTYPIPKKAKMADKRNIKMPDEALKKSHALMDHDYCWHAYYEVAINSVLPDKPRKEKKKREYKKRFRKQDSDEGPETHEFEDMGLVEEVVETDHSPVDDQDPPFSPALSEETVDEPPQERKKRKYVRRKPRKSDDMDPELLKQQREKREAKARADAENKVKICGGFQDHFIYFATKKIKSRTRNLDKNKPAAPAVMDINPGDLDFQSRLWVPSTGRKLQAETTTGVETQNLQVPRPHPGSVSPGRREDVFELVEELTGMMPNGEFGMNVQDSSFDSSMLMPVSQQPVIQQRSSEPSQIHEEISANVEISSQPESGNLASGLGEMVPNSSDFWSPNKNIPKQEVDDILKNLTPDEIKDILTMMNNAGDPLMESMESVESVSSPYNNSEDSNSQFVNEDSVNADNAGSQTETTTKVSDTSTSAQPNETLQNTLTCTAIPVTTAENIASGNSTTTSVPLSEQDMMNQSADSSLFELDNLTGILGTNGNNLGNINAILNDLSSPGKGTTPAMSSGQPLPNLNVSELGEKMLSGFNQDSPLKNVNPSQNDSTYNLPVPAPVFGENTLLDKSDLFPDISTQPVSAENDICAPELTTVTLFWNTFPALMINNVPHVRLVDIHKQALPAKDTGLLKKRCITMGLPIKLCSEMQRDFLIRYARAAASKSTVVVSKDVAEQLIGFYVNPPPKAHHRKDDTHTDVKHDIPTGGKGKGKGKGKSGPPRSQSMDDAAAEQKMSEAAKKRSQSLDLPKKQKFVLKLGDELVKEVTCESNDEDTLVIAETQEKGSVIPTTVNEVEMKPKRRRTTSVVTSPSKRSSRLRSIKRIRYDHMVQGVGSSSDDDNTEKENVTVNDESLVQDKSEPLRVDEVESESGGNSVPQGTFSGEYEKFVTVRKVGFGKPRRLKTVSPKMIQENGLDSKTSLKKSVEKRRKELLLKERELKRQARSLELKHIKQKELKKLKMQQGRRGLKKMSVEELQKLKKAMLKKLKQKTHRHSQANKPDHCYSFLSDECDEDAEPENEGKVAHTEEMDELTIAENCEVKPVILCDGEAKPCSVEIAKASPLEITHRDNVHKEGQRGRSQDGSLFLHLYKTKNSQCIQCHTCNEYFTLNAFKKHLHDANDPDIIIEALVSQRVELRNNSPSDEEQRLWEEYLKLKEKYLGRQSTPGTRTPQSRIVQSLEHRFKEMDKLAADAEKAEAKPEGCSTRHSTRERKRKQLYPIEKYTYSKLLPNTAPVVKKQAFTPDVELSETRYSNLDQHLLPSEVKAEVKRMALNVSPFKKLDDSAGSTDTSPSREIIKKYDLCVPKSPRDALTQRSAVVTRRNKHVAETEEFTAMNVDT